MKFSANLGFLWTEVPLPDGIRAAAAAGFDAVEFHAPYHYSASVMAEVLQETRLEATSINTRFGDQDGDFGIAAMSGREAEARDFIDEAIAYATAIACPAVHVTAGHSERSGQSEEVYCANLAYATSQAAEAGLTILIEPLSDESYHVTRIAQCLATIETLGAPNLKLLVDCFHSERMEPDLTEVFEQNIEHVGHVQFASIPDRREPRGGTVDYVFLLPHIVALGYNGAFGAEYNPTGTTDEGIHWLPQLRVLTQEDSETS